MRVILSIVVAAGAVALLLVLVVRESIGTFGSGRRATSSPGRSSPPPS